MSISFTVYALDLPDNKFFVYEDKSEIWMYLYTIEDIQYL